MLLTKETDYGIRGLINLALSEREYKSVRTIASEEEIPYVFLRRIFNKLKSEGYIKTREGSCGGATLARPPEKINIADLAGILQDKVEIISCVFRSAPCRNRSDCPVRKKLKRAEKSLMEDLRKITLKELSDEV